MKLVMAAGDRRGAVKVIAQFGRIWVGGKIIHYHGVVAIIPARGGSRGVPGKNLTRVGGVPLVGRAINTAQMVPAINAVYVSTDDPEIGEVAQQYGAQVIRRPATLSGDEASSESALLHALDEIAASSGYPAVVAFLQATSPFIPARSLERAVSRVQGDDLDVVFSVVPFHGFLWQESAGVISGINHDQSMRLRRQDRSPEYLETGAFYVMNAPGFRSARHRFFGRIGTEIVPEATAVDIDTMADLELARALASIFAPELRQIRARALVMDFDGVHTDNRAMIDASGNELATVNRSDGMGIELLKEAGVPLLIISKERVSIALSRAGKLGIEAACAVDDKQAYLRSWCSQRAISLADVAYVGNDINDLSCLNLVGWPIAVADAHPMVLRAARVVLNAAGGEGAIREIAELILGQLDSP